MSYRIRELARAQSDVHGMLRWLESRFQQGARTWLRTYHEILEKVKENPNTYGEAEECLEFDFDVRQVHFKTPRGNPYRLRYFLDDEMVTILRVRGTGQTLVER